VLLPKVEHPGDLARLDEALASGGAVPALWAMIETPAGVQNVEAICAVPSPGCLVMGTSDLAKALRVPHTPHRSGLLYSLSRCVLAARSAGREILDGVQLDLGDDDALEAVCRQGRELGFDGKTLIHPRQVDAANRHFGPHAAQLAQARAVLDAWEQARIRGQGVVLVNGQLVEQLHVDEAHRLCALAERIASRGGARRPPA
jgi:citrate lyase subunit beta/citryl-CoA lyase